MENFQKDINYLKKLLMQWALLVLSIMICSIGCYQFWLKPKKEMNLKIFQVAYDTEDKSLNEKSHNQLLTNITKNPNRYRLCVEEKRFQIHEYYSDTLKLIDRQTNEWEWRHDFDG